MDRDRVLTVGDNIAVLRKAAGMTQHKLAREANVSHSLLTKVETGDRPASHAFVAAVARALHVPIERVYGQPYDGSDVPTAVDALRVVLRGYDLPPAGETPPRSFEDLRASALEAAKRLAPEQTRYHPMVRETTRALLTLHRRSNAELTAFTAWLGIEN